MYVYWGYNLMDLFPDNDPSKACNEPVFAVFLDQYQVFSCRKKHSLYICFFTVTITYGKSKCILKTDIHVFE